jgi:hypothetical protein
MHHTHQSRVRLAWEFTRKGDTTQLESGCGSDLAPDVLRSLLEKLTPEPSSTDFFTPPSAYTNLCSNQVTRTRLLRELPTLDEINIVVQRKGNESSGV